MCRHVFYYNSTIRRKVKVFQNRQQDFVYDAVDLVGNDFPDFFKLRPAEAIEPDLSFLTEAEKSKFEFELEHDHAKREQPPQSHGEKVRKQWV